jgi:hypothetical protein
VSSSRNTHTNGLRTNPAPGKAQRTAAADVQEAPLRTPTPHQLEASPGSFSAGNHPQRCAQGIQELTRIAGALLVAVGTAMLQPGTLWLVSPGHNTHRLLLCDAATARRHSSRASSGACTAIVQMQAHEGGPPRLAAMSNTSNQHQHPCKRSTRQELLRKVTRNTLQHTTHTRHSISNMMLPAARQRPAAACTGLPPTAKSLRCTRHLTSRLQHSSCHKHSGCRLCKCRPSPSTHTHITMSTILRHTHTTEENPGLHNAASMI